MRKEKEETLKIKSYRKEIIKYKKP